MPRKPSPSDTALLLDHQLCFALYSASLAMTKLYKPLLAPLGLTYPQYLALLCLWESDGVTVSHLGEKAAGIPTALACRYGASAETAAQLATLREALHALRHVVQAGSD